MGLVDFQVILQQPLKVFWAGEVVAGHVLVNLSETKKMSGIKIRLVGRGEVRRKKRLTIHANNTMSVTGSLDGEPDTEQDQQQGGARERAGAGALQGHRELPRHVLLGGQYSK